MLSFVWTYIAAFWVVSMVAAAFFSACHHSPVRWAQIEGVSMGCGFLAALALLVWMAYHTRRSLARPTGDKE